jgi:hypothetical protein
MSSYSKGARGLSVLSRETSIFTCTTNSLSLSPRQRSNRYAIHAGRNLPDKEFRYLRTVIVTAAVYWGFSSKLRQKLTSPINLPALGRRQTLYFLFRVLQSPVFLLNSRLSLFVETYKRYSRSRHPFSRSYGVSLPSSLVKIISTP